jgi:ABC-2 type transport system permease protein
VGAGIGRSGGRGPGGALPSGRLRRDRARLTLTGVQVSQLAVVVLAVLTAGGEYATGTIHVTLTAVPRRASLL